MDDGSTDGTRAIVELYQDSRMKYIWQENQKESSARNHGVRLSTGKWICFQDSDDEYLPQHLQILHDAIFHFPEHKVVRSGLLLYRDGKFFKKSTIAPVNRYDQFPYECITTAAFHRSIFDEFQFEQKIFTNEDLHFLLRVGMKYDTKVLDFWTGIYHYDPTSSGGLGPNYEINLLNRRLCLDDILIWNKLFIQAYLKRARCLTEILLLSGHFKYDKSKILMGLGCNLSCFFRFPKDYSILSFDIFYTKFGEWTGFYNKPDRF